MHAFNYYRRVGTHDLKGPWNYPVFGVPSRCRKPQRSLSTTGLDGRLPVTLLVVVRMPLIRFFVSGLAIPIFPVVLYPSSSVQFSFAMGWICRNEGFIYCYRYARSVPFRSFAPFLSVTRSPFLFGPLINSIPPLSPLFLQILISPVEEKVPARVVGRIGKIIKRPCNLLAESWRETEKNVLSYRLPRKVGFECHLIIKWITELYYFIRENCPWWEGEKQRERI